MQFERYFRLADRARGSGVCCSNRGLFVGETALLERADASDDRADWRPRPLADLNRDLARAYGLPVEFGAKIGGLAIVARALGRGDLAYAQIATLLLQIPDPPSLTKSDPTSPESLDLARNLQASGLLNRDWDPAKHPRWPAHSPDGVGGRFAPRDGAAAAEASAPDASTIQAQVTLPLPFDIPAIEFDPAAFGDRSADRRSRHAPAQPAAEPLSQPARMRERMGRSGGVLPKVKETRASRKRRLPRYG